MTIPSAGAPGIPRYPWPETFSRAIRSCRLFTRCNTSDWTWRATSTWCWTWWATSFCTRCCVHSFWTWCTTFIWTRTSASLLATSYAVMTRVNARISFRMSTSKRGWSAINWRIIVAYITSPRWLSRRSTRRMPWLHASLLTYMTISTFASWSLVATSPTGRSMVGLNWGRAWRTTWCCSSWSRGTASTGTSRRTSILRCNCFLTFSRGRWSFAVSRS